MRPRLSFSILLALLLISASLASCKDKNQRKFNLPVQELVITTKSGDVSVKAELAVKAEERNYGFMNRTDIPDGTGMLFVFEKDRMLTFWMKNTPHPLSIAYIDSSGIIADILDMTPFSEASVPSSRHVRYALEVPQGWFKANGISTGDTVQWKGNDTAKHELRTLPVRGEVES